jgi:hypothetical protein
MTKEAYLLEKINRYNSNGDTVVEISISKGTSGFDEEFSEHLHPFEKEDYVSERFFNEDGTEIDKDTWFGGMDEEFEEADWEEEAMFGSLKEAKENEQGLIDDL